MTRRVIGLEGGMTQWIERLRETRGELVERGATWAGQTRDRGVEVLGKVRSGTLDWHATLEARREDLAKGEPSWPLLADLQLKLVERLDQALVRFSQRVREEIERLAQLELGSPPEADTAAPKAKGAEATKAAKTKAKTKPTKSKAKSKATKSKATQTKATQTKAAKTKAAKAKRPRAKAGGTRLVMPIAGYDELTAKEVLAELGGLSASQREIVRAHEAAHKNRKTVLRALER